VLLVTGLLEDLTLPIAYLHTLQRVETSAMIPASKKPKTMSTATRHSGSAQGFSPRCKVNLLKDGYLHGFGIKNGDFLWDFMGLSPGHHPSYW
jgi:hypothetical protein